VVDSIWVDGSPAAALPLPDRGFDFGDGLFETLLVVDGTALYLDLHTRRLQRGLAALKFPDCLNEVTGHIATALHSLPPGECVLRVTVTRGSGPRGYAPPPHTRPRVVIAAAPRERSDYKTLLSPAHLGLATMRWGTQPELAGIKHLNRLTQVLAARERQAGGLDEVVMLDQQGAVISLSAANLFIYDGDQLLTPALGHCGIQGTRRHLVLERLGPALGLQIRESTLSLQQLESAIEVFYCNALVGMRPVASFGSKAWSSHPVCSALHRLYCEGAP